ncbi:MAG: TlpA disulfide reductase family protein [Rikenellaceae bacterium]
MQKIKVRYSAVALVATIISSMFLSSCQSNKVKISGRFVGGNSSVAYLEEISLEGGMIVDSVELSSAGEFTFNLEAQDQHHKLYNIVYDWSAIPVFAAAGDNIKFNSVGNIAKNYTVEGSEESELMRQFYQNYIDGISSMDKIAMQYASESISEEERAELAKQYSAEHTRIKREQLEFIISNKANLAAVYALYQRLPNDSYLFNGRSDVIYYRTVAEALEESYPESPYIKSIQADINQFELYNTLESSLVEVNYPDLEINDMYGEAQKLSQLDGKVILLDFWSTQIGASNVNNAELKELYEDYKDNGFEIYQVAIDTSKSTWINAIQNQGLSWISVCDFKGSGSSALTLYNVTSLPANFLISKEGVIVGGSLYGAELEKMIKAELAK